MSPTKSSPRGEFFWRWAALTVAALGLYAWYGAGDWRLTSTQAQDPPRQPLSRQPIPREGQARFAIGLAQLQAKLRKATPTGRGVVVGHVEGNQGNYLPAIHADTYKGVEFLPNSGPSVVNGHAQSTCRIIYGPQGLAPGVQRVNFYSSYHWLRSGYLRTGTPRPPLVDDSRLLTHSWIGGGDDPFTRDALRRIDWIIDTHHVVMVCGVNNNADTEVPALLASAYNVISVGNWVGNSSGGYTKMDAPGRCKPDLVAPNNQTSFATPTVAAIVARLLEAADGLADDRAGRPQVIKAVLMAGAEKPPGFAPEEGKPLDNHLGAGRLRADRAYLLLVSPPVKPGRIPSRYGWGFNTLEPGQTAAYDIEIVKPLGEVSIILTWHRQIDGRTLEDLLTQEQRWVNTALLADLDLRLIRFEDDGSEMILDQSQSRLDNVEHVYRTKLDPGRYRIEVARQDPMNQPWEYAVAWRIEEAKE